MNTPAFSFATAINPEYGDRDPHLELPPGLGAIDLQGVTGPRLGDRARALTRALAAQFAAAPA